jgi:DNA-binding transcriptional LysR family regulator
MDRLSALMPFVRTAELGSFVAAGRSLGLSASAVGKGVTRLEAQLGVRLFQRTTRSLSLTDEGRMFQERCRRILDDLDDAQAALVRSTQTPRGRLRVSLPIASYHLFKDGFLAFILQFPDIELDIDFSDHMVDLVDEGIDIAIRSGELQDSRLIRRSLPTVQMICCASPAYLDAHGTPLVPRDLDGHAAVRFRYFKSGKIQDWPLERKAGEAEVRTKNVLVCNNMDMVRSALINGTGIGTIPDFLAREPLADRSLKAILTNYLISPDPFSMVWPSSRQLSHKIRLFVDFISQRLEQEMAILNSSISESIRL